MNKIAISWIRRLGLGALALVICLVTGCASSYEERADNPNPDRPFVFPGQEMTIAAAAPVPGYVAPAGGMSPATPRVEVPILPGSASGVHGTLRPGETVRVSFSDLPPPGLLEQQLRIGDDGKITLYLNVTVSAANKTAQQLQEDIRKEYVPRYYKRLTVTVKTEERFYYVGGEVRMPNRMIYLGQMSVLRAIDTAGGFSDFADRSNIELRRSNGQVFKISWKKAIKDPRLDTEVFPSDQVIVHRRSL